MVRSAITINDLSHAWTARESPDAIDVGNDHVINGADAYRYLILLVHISAGTGTGGDVSVAAGDCPPSFLESQGALAIGGDVTANEEHVLLIETARHLQDDGTIEIDVTNTSNTDLAGTLEVYGIE